MWALQFGRFYHHKDDRQFGKLCWGPHNKAWTIGQQRSRNRLTEDGRRARVEIEKQQEVSFGSYMLPVDTSEDFARCVRQCGKCRCALAIKQGKKTYPSYHRHYLIRFSKTKSDGDKSTEVDRVYYSLKVEVYPYGQRNGTWSWYESFIDFFPLQFYWFCVNFSKCLVSLGF